jgi:hypothetical protein
MYEKAKAIHQAMIYGRTTTEEERLFLDLYQRCHFVEQGGRVRSRLPEV